MVGMTKKNQIEFRRLLGSRLAEDFHVRHVFEDMLKLCDYKTGILDITRSSLSRRLNLPLEELNQAIKVLESPDADGFVWLARLRVEDDWGWAVTISW